MGECQVLTCLGIWDRQGYSDLFLDDLSRDCLDSGGGRCGRSQSLGLHRFAVGSMRAMSGGW